MRFAEFCDMAENTEQEQQLLQYFKQEELKESEQAFAKMSHIPFIGKMFTALIALSNYKSIAAFRKSRHYRHIMNYYFNIDFENRNLSINASDMQKKKIKKVAKIIAAISVGVALLAICRKLCCCKK